MNKGTCTIIALAPSEHTACTIFSPRIDHSLGAAAHAFASVDSRTVLAICPLGSFMAVLVTKAKEIPDSASPHATWSARNRHVEVCAAPEEGNESHSRTSSQMS